jgi:DNA invertase Pin-like site-specific DNA recombinase
VKRGTLVAEFTEIESGKKATNRPQLAAAMAACKRGHATRTKAGLAEVKREISEKGYRISRSGRTCTKLGNPRWTECIQRARDSRRSPAQIAGEVLSIVQAHRSEGKSLRAIAASLNTMGLRTPRGAQWYASTVRLLLVESA